MSTEQDTTAYDVKLLSAGYYIQGGIAAFYSIMMCGYFLLFGTVVFQTMERAATEKGEPIPPVVGPVLFAIFGFMVFAAVLYAICTILSGYWLRRHKHRVFIQITAAFNCLGIPYGTALGICTFIVLQRPSAKQLFTLVPVYIDQPSLPPTQ